MSDDPIASRFDLAVELARDAGAVALEFYARRGELCVEHKTEGVYDTATEADRAVEQRIRARIAERFPRDGFIGEESEPVGGAGDAERVWVVDPIDGTDCFVNGIPVWCVSIALVVAGRVELGVIYDPNHDELHAARAGHGATVNGKPARPNPARGLSDGVMGIGFNHRIAPDATLAIIARLLAAGGMFQRNGSGALMLAYVACGRLIAYYEAHMNAWDALAGIALVREAGGWTNDFLHADGLVRGSEIIACAPQLTGAVRALCGVA